MRNSLVIIVVTVLVTSCKSIEQQCVEKYPPKITRHDSIVYKERVDTVKWFIPGDTVTVKTPAPCDNFESDFNTGKEKIKIVVRNKIMYVDRYKEGDTLYALSKTTTVKVTSNENTSTNIGSRDLRWWFIISCAINIILMYFIVKRLLR